MDGFWAVCGSHDDACDIGSTRRTRHEIDGARPDTGAILDALQTILEAPDDIARRAT